VTVPAIELRDLRKAFGDLEVLRGIDLVVQHGEVVCVIGPSGSGKSTLLRCVNLLEEPTGGSVVVEGEEITHPDYELDDIRQRIGMVFQQFNLFPHLDVLGNLCIAPRRVRKRPRAEAEQVARRVLARVGLSDKERAYPAHLSGGQQQRVAIARSLALGPEVMLLDEITSALDPELVGEVLDVVRELKREGMTMLLATHEMAFAKEIADRVCFLHAGRILEDGPPAQLFEDPTEPRTRQFLQRVIDAGRL
jgi:polar amino acid transport system ATP-binding protein